MAFQAFHFYTNSCDDGMNLHSNLSGRSQDQNLQGPRITSENCRTVLNIKARHRGVIILNTISHRRQCRFPKKKSDSRPQSQAPPPSPRAGRGGPGQQQQPGPGLTCVAGLSSSTASKAMVENTQVLPVPDLACTMRSAKSRHRGHRRPRGAPSPAPGPSPGPPAHPGRSAPAGWPSAGPATACGTQPPPAPPAPAPTAAVTRSRTGRRESTRRACGTVPPPPPAPPRAPPSWGEEATARGAARDAPSTRAAHAHWENHPQRAVPPGGAAAADWLAGACGATDWLEGACVAADWLAGRAWPPIGWRGRAGPPVSAFREGRAASGLGGFSCFWTNVSHYPLFVPITEAVIPRCVGQ